MKKFLLALLLLAGVYANSQQVYNNEWINYNQTYYKFKLRFDGLYRIPQPMSVQRDTGVRSSFSHSLKILRRSQPRPRPCSKGSQSNFHLRQTFVFANVSINRSLYETFRCLLLIS